MGIEVRPLGVLCNIACQYCYQQPQRDTGNVSTRYDLEAIKRAVLQYGTSFIVFGGEPLLVPLADLEELWKWGYDKFGRNGVQTNGTLISSEHIRLFKQYHVQVGISIDGPGPLNDARWAGSLLRTRELTSRVEDVIELLCRERVSTSIIITLHRCNATPDHLPQLHDWLRHLDNIGVSSCRLHVLEVDNSCVADKYALSTEENLTALLSFVPLERTLKRMTIDVFGDLRSMLLAQDDAATCVWKACDPYTTDAVQGIEGFGVRSNCGRTNKDGIDYVKADEAGFERYIALYQTPQAKGGCQGCRFFLMCKGQCPGTALDGDWRNKTEHCDLWMRLYEHIENRLLAEGKRPISLDPNLGYLEINMIDAWKAGVNPSLSDMLKTMRAADPCGKPSNPASTGQNRPVPRPQIVKSSPETIEDS
ncbi:Anaerobic sulfatase-maturating enzyme [Gemmata sp. SH-PL17]|uniref:radical SAM protein n=1 Tax=Gemmata sp. SH-PL17 TaxID=1630693 RepID=UPI00078DCD13|nr:radical SAM protein [Gemmata sp. SH-PL17]AMV25190.1 Anaerobic sulfatase-maturating enzyme [Gemmata sp. SH-PL17]